MSGASVPTIMLIDGRNVMYRAIHAGKSNNQHENPYHYFVIFLRQLTGWMNRYRPESVHMFWDSPRNTVWRKKILATYKDRDKSDYVRDIKDDLMTTTTVAMEMFQVMGVRQYLRKAMEADDLIYTAATVFHPKKMVIVSSDGDMMQIPYNFHSSVVFDPKKMEEKPVPDYSPVMLKSLVGDPSDSIPGYDGIGPVKGKRLLDNMHDFQTFIRTVDPKLFYRNLALIDLSLCPEMLANKRYIHKTMAAPVVWDKTEINKRTMQYKINGLLQEFSNLVLPFKDLQ